MASRACDRNFLVMDDFGREGDAQIRRADICDIISARYDAKLPTVITTELTLSDIIKAYGLYAVNKLAEDSEGHGGMIADCGDESLCLENYESLNCEADRECDAESESPELDEDRRGMRE